MFKDYIINYSSKITKENIKDFALKNNIILSEKESDIIFNSIHYDIKELLNDPIIFLDKRKDKFENTTYLKIKDLIIFYINKYKNYL